MSSRLHTPCAFPRKQTVLCVLLALPLGETAAAPGWDCRQGPDGKEWICQTEKPKPTAEAPAAKPAAPGRPSTPLPADDQAITQTAPPVVPKPPAPVRPSAPLPADDQAITRAPPSPPKSAPAVPAAAPNPRAAVKSGWNCRAGTGKDWDCALSGADPRGEARVVGEDSSSTEEWTHSSDMTPEDERRFAGILTRMPSNPWALSCGRGKREWSKGTEFLMTDADRINREAAPLEIQSEQAESLYGEVSNFQGAAELARADQHLFGDFVSHNRESSTLNAQGNVVYREKGLAFASDSAFMKLDTDEGILRNVQFVLETVPSRGTARLAYIDSKTASRYETATYTACPPGNQDWLLHATQVNIDKASGRGEASNAWLELLGVPIMYTPYMSFPIDDRRKSGLLTPYGGYSQQNGFDISLLYYFNLAPNYDLTMTARYMDRRGEQVRGDFRYLTEFGKGRLVADGIPYDDLKQEARGQVSWQNDSKFTNHISSHLDLHLVSDERYLYELGRLLAINNSTFLRSWADVKYTDGELFGGAYSGSVLVDYYQNLDPTIQPIDTPYRRMPQFNFNFNRSLADTGLQLQTHVELASFEQSYKVDGERLHMRPRIYYPFRDSAGYITPSLGLDYTDYWLNNTAQTEANNFTRVAPVFSLDSGAYFEREFELFGAAMQQTLEPRLYYLYVPTVNQPYAYNNGQGLNFDTNEYDFSFYQLFRENRFAGSDRLSDANNITPALTTRFISEDSGLERLKLSIGKVFYLTSPKVVLVPGAAQTTTKDNIVAEASSMLSEHWSLRSTGQWNPVRDRIDRGQVALQYNDYANNLLNLSYRYRRDPYADSLAPVLDDPSNPRTINQTDISTRLPLGGGWYFIGRWQYNLASQVTVETMAGFERETCCWRFSLVGLRYINGALGQVATSDNVSTNNAVFFQIELKGLGRFGDQIDNLLARNFSGYRTDYDAPSVYP